MVTVATIYFALVALFTLGAWLLRWRGFSAFDPPAGAVPDETVTVIVPMRDEEVNAERCLTALRAQTQRRLEVVVVDDASSDRTPEILRRFASDWPQLKIVRLEGCPPGWTGKNHAMHRGVAAASGDWFLFLDADVEISPDTVARTLAACRKNCWPALSIHGGFLTASFWEAVMQPWFAITLLRMQLELGAAFFIGHFMFLSREIYDATGGFAAIAEAISDDLEIGLLLEEHGVPARVRYWPGAFRCRMYRSFGEIWAGWSRIFAVSTWFQAWRSGLFALHLLLARLLPALVVLSAVWWLDPRQPRELGLALAAAAAAGLDWLLHARIAHTLASPAPAMACKPLGDALAFAILCDATYRCASGRIVYRGRTYRPTAVARWLEARPRPAAAAPRLSVVCAALSAASETVRATRIARELPAAEVVLVAPGAALPADPPSNLRLVAAAPGDPLYTRWRLGWTAASGDWIALLPRAWDGEVAWLSEAMRAASTSDADLVVGRARYASDTAWGRAATLLELGRSKTPWLGAALAEACPLAARRTLFETLSFGEGFREGGGLWLFVLLASRRGGRVHEVGEPVLTVPWREPGAAGCGARAERRYGILWDFVHRTRDWRAEPMPLSALVDCLFPALASTRIAAEAWFGFARAAPATRTPAVAAWLAGQTLIDYAVAWAAILDPAAFARKATARRLTIAAEVDSRPEHVLRRLIPAAVSAAVRERPVRARRD